MTVHKIYLCPDRQKYFADFFKFDIEEVEEEAGDEGHGELEAIINYQIWGKHELLHQTHDRWAEYVT